jgi:hypothetical protein
VKSSANWIGHSTLKRPVNGPSRLEHVSEIIAEVVTEVIAAVKAGHHVNEKANDATPRKSLGAVACES